ncbi:hypothetical protein MJO29_005728 [Puccinia striiformis f. sp. tritici]|nr:hypothetical protein MJO29_005728 [Puccinia striiformis f. sp. tritici]
MNKLEHREQVNGEGHGIYTGSLPGSAISGVGLIFNIGPGTRRHTSTTESQDLVAVPSSERSSSLFRNHRPCHFRSRRHRHSCASCHNGERFGGHTAHP